MKNKSNLLLLLLLPLLTSCPPIYDGPSYKIKELENTSIIQFRLDEGINLTVPYGLYNQKAHDTLSTRPEHFMFMVTNSESYTDKDAEMTCVYEITSPISECYWRDSYYSKEAKIHLDSRFFIPDCDTITFILGSAGEDDYQPGKETYTRYEIDWRLHRTYYYCVDEEQMVSLSYFRTNLPNYVEESSSGSTHRGSGIKNK